MNKEITFKKSLSSFGKRTIDSDTFISALTDTELTRIIEGGSLYGGISEVGAPDKSISDQMYVDTESATHRINSINIDRNNNEYTVSIFPIYSNIPDFILEKMQSGEVELGCRAIGYVDSVGKHITDMTIVTFDLLVN